MPEPVSAAECDAILAGLRLLQSHLERGCLDGDILDLHTNDGAHCGLGPDSIDSLCESINCGDLTLNESAPTPPGGELSSPSISAEAWPDGRPYGPPFTVKFDAAPVFATLTDEQLFALAVDYWANSEASDAVAETAASWSADVARVFDYLASVHEFSDRTCGFECNVNGPEAMAWLREHRRGLWARVLCHFHEVELVRAEEPEILGRWDWIFAEEGQACDMSHDTEDDAALDAVGVLGLAERELPPV